MKCKRTFNKYAGKINGLYFMALKWTWNILYYKTSNALQLPITSETTLTTNSPSSHYISPSWKLWLYLNLAWLGHECLRCKINKIIHCESVYCWPLFDPILKLRILLTKSTEFAEGFTRIPQFGKIIVHISPVNLFRMLCLKQWWRFVRGLIICE